MLYVDHQTLIRLAGSIVAEANENELSEFRDKVRARIDALDNEYSQVVFMYFFEDKNAAAIANELELSIAEVNKRLREALLILKHSLADLVVKRWHKAGENIKPCPVCNSPYRLAIEKIIKSKKPESSWSAINKRLKKQFGIAINPPSLMINHLKYHMKG